MTEKNHPHTFNAQFFELLLDGLYNIVEGQEHIPIEVANLAAFIFYWYKFLSRAKDKNLYRLPYRIGQEHVPI